MQINGTLILLYFIEMLPRTVSTELTIIEQMIINQIIKDNQIADIKYDIKYSYIRNFTCYLKE